MNKLYMEQNLVVGYLANNPINTLNQSTNSSNGSDSSTDDSRRTSDIAKIDSDTDVIYLIQNRES